MDNKQNGKGTFRWANGATYQGDYLNGKKNGYGIYILEDGGRYVRKYKLKSHILRKEISKKIILMEKENFLILAEIIMKDNG